MRRPFSIKPGASQERLERLIEERLRSGADKKRIDERIWELFGEGSGTRTSSGAEVNAASKLGEDRARAWEILVTGAIEERCRGAEGLRFEPVADPPAGARTAFRVHWR